MGPALSPAQSHVSSMSTDQSTNSGGSNQSVAGSIRGTSGAAGNRLEPVHRAFSLHGSIAIRAKIAVEEKGSQSKASPMSSATVSNQLIHLPFFTTVCHSLFTAALLDPISGLTSGPQQSSGQLVIDFGGDSVVGCHYHRDILLINRSEIELVWNTSVANSRNKDAVWFSLRDLDSENVFGVDSSSQPVPLPALSSRHLRLELRVKAPIASYDFDFMISNLYQSDNIITCRASGSGQAEAVDSPLKVLGGLFVDFGQICDGAWAKKHIKCKNTGEQPLDVRFSATLDHDVVFQLASVAGEDIGEDSVVEDRRLGRFEPNRAARPTWTSARDSANGIDRTVFSHPSRGGSSSSSAGRDTSSRGQASPGVPNSFSTDLSRHLGALDGDAPRLASELGAKVPNFGYEDSLPPSRSLSRAVSRGSSYIQAQPSAESDEDNSDLPFYYGGDALITSNRTANIDPIPQIFNVSGEKNISNQIEDLTMRSGTEYNVCVLYRPSCDTAFRPETAGAFSNSTFHVFLDVNSSSHGTTIAKSRQTLKCFAESCTSFIRISSGNKIDFGEVTIGAVRSSSISISNLSALSAEVEIAAISKVLNTNRKLIVIPPFETVEEKLELIPRRINDRYEKQIFVRNLLNRSNGVFVFAKLNIY